MDETDRLALIDAWIEYDRMSSGSDRALRLKSEESLGWVRDRMLMLPFDEPELAWDILLDIADQYSNERVWGMAVAGLLQDLVSEHSMVFAARIEKQARQNANFREMLGSLRTIPDELFQQIKHLLPQGN